MLETRGDVAEALSRRKGGNGIRSWYEVVDAELSAALALNILALYILFIGIKYAV